MQRRIVLGCIVLIVTVKCIAATTRAHAVTRPATTTSTHMTTRRAVANPNESSRAAIRAAVDALSREYSEHLANPQDHSLRSTSNYFDQAAREKILPEAVVDSLIFRSRDAR